MPREAPAKSLAEFFLADMCAPGMAILIVLAALVLLVAACVFLIRTRGLAPIASFLPLTALPFLLGVFAGLLRAVNVVSLPLGYGTKIDGVQLVAEVAASAAPMLLGLACGAPAFFVTTIALLVRSLRISAGPDA